MPTGVHDCHQHWVKNEMLDWVAANSLTFDELKYLEVAVGTTFRNFQVPYTSSSKEPDLSIRSDAQELPQIVFESGWAEFWPRLHQGMQLWLTGGQPMVHLVILLKWSQLSRNRVTGVVEVFDRDTAGSPRPRQTETIFLAPATMASQTIAITCGQLFGSAALAGRNASDVLYLSIETLRPSAIQRIQFMGLGTA